MSPTTRRDAATLTMTRGLPGSGKSTWATGRVRDAAPGSVVRISKDMLRTMLHADIHAKGTEPQVLAARDALIATYLASGVSVIVDDTNLVAHHETTLRSIAARHQVPFHIEDFTHVPLDECLRRNASRVAPVPEHVIRDMYTKHLATSAPSDSTPLRRDAVVVDLDGTLALHRDRSPFEWTKVSSDVPNDAVVLAVRALAAAGIAIVYCSGRDSVCRTDTESWITTHVGIDGPLFMRSYGDNRRDSIVKRELYEQHIAPAYHVRFVLDDRDQVVQLWRDDLQLPCFQVAPGDF
jgi:predicted kinase